MIQISFWNIAFTVVNLLILFVGVRAFFFKPIKKIIEDRQKEADAMFNQATQEEHEAEELKHHYEEELLHAQEEKKQVIIEARKTADAEYKHILEDARHDAQVIRDAAVVEAEHVKAEIIDTAKKEVADMVVEATSKVVASKTGADVDSELFDKFIGKAGE